MQIKIIFFAHSIKMEVSAKEISKHIIPCRIVPGRSSIRTLLPLVFRIQDELPGTCPGIFWECPHGHVANFSKMFQNCHFLLPSPDRIIQFHNY